MSKTVKRPTDYDPLLLSVIVEDMRRLGIKSLEYPSIKIELNDQVPEPYRIPATATPSQSTTAESDGEEQDPEDAVPQCACGHHVITEHSDAGCYYGCTSCEIVATPPKG